MLQVRFNVSLVECSIDCGGCGPSPLFWPGYIHLPVILETFLEHFWNIWDVERDQHVRCAVCSQPERQVSNFIIVIVKKKSLIGWGIIGLGLNKTLR